MSKKRVDLKTISTVGSGVKVAASGIPGESAAGQEKQSTTALHRNSSSKDCHSACEQLLNAASKPINM